MCFMILLRLKVEGSGLQVGTNFSFQMRYICSDMFELTFQDYFDCN